MIHVEDKFLLEIFNVWLTNLDDVISLNTNDIVTRTVLIDIVI